MSLIQARFGEDTYPIGQFLFERARALGISRSELNSLLGYRQIGKGHKALTGAMMTGTVPPFMRKHLAFALEVDDALVDTVVAATAAAARRSTSIDTCARGCLQGRIQAASAHRNRPHNPGADLHRRPTRNSPVAARRGVERGMERERR
jgi:hypothetical protein